MKLVFTTADRSVRVFFDEGGRWWVDSGQGMLKLEGGQSFASLMPLLEESPRVIAVESGETFPIEEVVLCALCFGSAYWKELSLAWIEALDIWSDNVGEQVALLAARGSRWPQRLRHRAAMLLRKNGLKP